MLDLPLLASALDGLPAETAAALLAALRGLLAHAPNARSPEGTPS